jgi:hypothetical protein
MVLRQEEKKKSLMRRAHCLACRSADCGSNAHIQYPYQTHAEKRGITAVDQVQMHLPKPPNAYEHLSLIFLSPSELLHQITQCREGPGRVKRGKQGVLYKKAATKAPAPTRAPEAILTAPAALLGEAELPLAPALPLGLPPSLLPLEELSEPEELPVVAAELVLVDETTAVLLWPTDTTKEVLLP